jgi:hypothetical protein
LLKVFCYFFNERERKVNLKTNQKKVSKAITILVLITNNQKKGRTDTKVHRHVKKKKNVSVKNLLKNSLI